MPRAMNASPAITGPSRENAPTTAAASTTTVTAAYQPSPGAIPARRRENQNQPGTSRRPSGPTRAQYRKDTAHRERSSGHETTAPTSASTPSVSSGTDP